MSVHLSRLRVPEWLIGISSVALLLDASFVRWFGASDAWSSFGLVRYLLALAAVCGLFASAMQAVRRAPAVPICATVITLPLAGLLVAALIVRVLIAPPAGAAIHAGSYVGLGLALTLVAGAYLSMRKDGIRDVDGPGPIERLSVPTAPADSA